MSDPEKYRKYFTKDHLTGPNPFPERRLHDLPHFLLIRVRKE